MNFALIQNKNYPKSSSKLYNSNETKVKQPIKATIDEDDELFESIKAGGCELISPNRNY